MRIPKLAAAALALALAVPPGRAAEPTAADVQKELAALKARIEELERAQKAAGMTPEQQAELDRITIKAEALEDSRDAGGFKGLKLGAWMDPIFQYNADLNRAQFLFLSPVAAEPYGYSASYAGTLALDVQKETENGTKLRITLMPARSSADVAEALGSIVHEASFSIPLGNLQTRLIGGQLPDWSGYEYLPPTQNKLISHNLLFDFTLPGFYTGAGLELVRGNWDVKAMVANLNAGHRKDFEWAPVVAYRGDYWFTEYSGFGFAGVHGKAPSYAEGATRDTWLDLFEIDGYYTRGALNLQGQLGAGHQKDASITPDPDTGALRDAMWIGASALVSYKFRPRLEGILRGDVVLDRWNGGGLLGYASADDRNGIGPNPNGDPEKGADRWAVTVGLDYAFTQNATFKLEYRLDGATQPVFRANDADAEVDPAAVKYARTNHLASTSLVLFF
jgi:opacity protein-like surface antigen